MSEERFSCEQAVPHLSAYLDGRLDSGTSEAVARHLAICQPCSSRAEFEKRLRARVRVAGTQRAPERLYRRVRRMLDSSGDRD